MVVDHPKTRFIAFTGSKEIGLRINERAAKVHDGQIWIKRVVAEMGGKDAIIVADDANLDEAATGVVQSAFGLSGPEMFGVFARDHRRASLRFDDRKDYRARRENQRRQSD